MGPAPKIIETEWEEQDSVEQEVVAQRFEGALDGEALKILIDSDISGESQGCRQNVGKNTAIC